ncbi:MAG TPA: DUF72 domain-containing protein, partial [bacterium]|nr:DUF72 domain-containing protein [bacterium]
MAPRVLIGTSGYSYADWVGPVYPEGTRSQDFLSLYARDFPVVELNFSYYKQPSARTLERMVALTPPSFRFAIKAHRSITHEISESWDADVAAFKEGIQPLVGSGRLASVLAQFPHGFAYTPASRERLAKVCESFQGLSLAVEFRRREWQREQVLDGLRTRGVSLVSVDEPDLPGLLPPTEEATGPFGYIRFHGRNAATWWTGDNASRYDYLYSPQELTEWVDRI